MYAPAAWAAPGDTVAPTYTEIVLPAVTVVLVADALGVKVVAPAGVAEVFQPPVQLRKDYGITDINIRVEYLGANLQVSMEVEKTSLFKFDKSTKLVFDLAQFRASPTTQLSQYLSEKIDELMGRGAKA